jgi:hypothetical protein
MFEGTMFDITFEDIKDKLRENLGTTIATALVVFANVAYANHYWSKHSIPTVEKVQQGYVIPSKLEIKLQDLDGNRQKEVIMKYDGKNYLLTLDEQGKPRVQAYEVKPTEVLKKN